MGEAPPARDRRDRVATGGIPVPEVAVRPVQTCGAQIGARRGLAMLTEAVLQSAGTDPGRRGDVTEIDRLAGMALEEVDGPTDHGRLARLGPATGRIVQRVESGIREGEDQRAGEQAERL